jgi:alpha-tubulin suppressor-like RCC1 family protein
MRVPINVTRQRAAGLIQTMMPEEPRARWGRRMLGLAGGSLLLFLAFWRPWERSQVVRLPSGPGTVRVSLGDAHGLVIAPDGSLWSWGGEELGWPVLGLRTNGAPPLFVPKLRQVGTDTHWVSASAGSDHNLLLRDDGSIWSWGANLRHQAGIATNQVRLVPGLAVEGNDWTEVIAGFGTSHALKRNGTLWAWGLNNFGQLGIGSTTGSPMPVQVGTATHWWKVRMGGVSGAGIQSDGSLWIWGGSPKLGNTVSSSTNNLISPVRVAGGGPWTDVCVAFNLWAGVKSDGTLWIWGREAPGFTGGTPASGEQPMRWGADSDWKACVSSGDGRHLVLQRRDGSLWELQTSVNPHPGDSAKLRRVALDEAPVSFKAGGGAGVAVSPQGDLWGWGTQLGRTTLHYRLQTRWEEIGTWFGHPADWVRPERVIDETPRRLATSGPGGVGR